MDGYSAGNAPANASAIAPSNARSILAPAFRRTSEKFDRNKVDVARQDKRDKMQSSVTLCLFRCYVLPRLSGGKTKRADTAAAAASMCGRPDSGRRIGQLLPGAWDARIGGGGDDVQGDNTAGAED
jgi:hypothetical protein